MKGTNNNIGLTKKQEIRNSRAHFCTDNDLHKLVNTVVTEDFLINLLNSLGIKTYMCIDPDCKDEFFDLSGISIEGKHDYNSNRMVFKLFKF